MSAMTPGSSVSPRLVLMALLIATASTLVAPASAGAKRGLTTGIADPPSYLSPNSASRDIWFNRTAQGNVDLVRIDIVWRNVAPERPGNPGHPGDPAYDFSAVDAAVGEAAQRGLQVLLTPYGAPNWAEGQNPPDRIADGAWRPDPGDFGSFGSALARRYSGGFSPGAGAPPLPKVRYFEAWNEPNLEVFLAPQWEGDRVEGPAMYRSLLNAFYDGVKGVDPGNTVISGGTTSFGDPPGGDRTRPVFFLRELFCLEGRLKPRPRPGCGHAKLDALGHHPISTQNPPTYSAIHPDDAAMADFGALRQVLRAAEKGDVVRPGGRRPIWATEFWWHTAIPPARQARYVQQALYVLWKQRVKVAIHYLIRELPPYQGMFSRDGGEKPAFQAFRFPFVTDRLRRKRIRAWGRSPVAGKVKLQRKKGSGWKTLKRIRVREDEVFTARLRGGKKMRAQIGGDKSVVWRNRR